jgi:hypothetical protein
MGKDCERLVVGSLLAKTRLTPGLRAARQFFRLEGITATQNSQNSNSQEAGHLGFEAVLRNSVANIRYQSALKRDLYREMDTLRKMQEERRELTESIFLRR